MANNKKKLPVTTTTLPKETKQVVQPTIASPTWYSNQSLLVSILTITVLITFSGGFSNDFTSWDDPAYITSNIFIQNPTFANLLHLLKVEVAQNYHPVTMATLWLNAFLFGKGATSFIITNALIHILNTLLVFKFTKQLAQNNNLIAFFTALLWGVHPLHVESVTWISERKDVLYACFFWLSCIQYIRFIKTQNYRFLIYTFIFFIFSCLSKGMAVVLPLVLLLIDYWQDENWSLKKSTKNILPKIPFFVVALLFGLLTIHVQAGGNLGGNIEKMTPSVDIVNTVFTFWQRICFGFYGFWVYIFKLFIPIQLHNGYSYPHLYDFNNIKYLISPVIAISVLGVVTWNYRRYKTLFFGGMFFFFTISIVLQFISVGGTILAERYSYIPSFGIIFIVVYWLSSKISPKTLSIIFGTISLVFMFLTFQYTHVYKNDYTLSAPSIELEKENSPFVNAYRVLMIYFSKQKDGNKVVQYGEELLTKGVTKPSSSIYYDLAIGYDLIGKYSKALENYDKALLNANNEEKAKIYNNRGVTNRSAGNFEQAAADFENVLKFDSTKKNISGYLKEIGYAYFRTNNFERAKETYTKMIVLGICVDTAYNNRGSVKINLNDPKGAIQDYKEALKISPNYTDAQNNLKRMGVK